MLHELHRQRTNEFASPRITQACAAPGHRRQVCSALHGVFLSESVPPCCGAATWKFECVVHLNLPKHRISQDHRNLVGVGAGWATWLKLSSSSLDTSTVHFHVALLGVVDLAWRAEAVSTDDTTRVCAARGWTGKMSCPRGRWMHSASSAPVFPVPPDTETLHTI